jgi:L-iditol 2-dehydrogenase
LDEVTDIVLNGYRKGFDLTQLISHRFPIEQAVEAIDIASHPPPESMKIMIEPVLGGGGK